MTNTFELRNELDAEFDKESDRGCAILTLCLLEEALSQVFAAFLPGGERHTRHFMPRGRLSVGIEHAHKLGLIGDANLATFKALLEIRNKFAHSILSDMSFTSDAIREKLLKLELPNLEAVPDVLEQLDSNPRQRFMIAVDNLFFTLSARNGELADPLKNAFSEIYVSWFFTPCQK